MDVHSSLITSRQTDIHPRLAEVLDRHRRSPDLTPITPFTQALWPQLLAFAARYPQLILDLGCGTGMSTLHLAAANPQAAVIGIDRSRVRLERAASMPANAQCWRADQFDVLRLLRQEKLSAAVYLLYPNPAPKPEHLKRRWHAHPIWPCLLHVARHIELRTNWHLYAQEFAFALTRSGWVNALASYTPEPPITRFEMKYWQSEHGLWRVQAAMPAALECALR
jgi:tRNA (guanine-N7-)-methyltransferase